MNEAASSKTLSKREMARLENEANAHAAAHRWRDAAATLSQVAKAAPDNAARWLQIAQWQREARDYRSAAQTLQSALFALHAPATSCSSRPAATIDVTRQIAPLWLALAETYAEAQNWMACIEACGALLQISPTNQNARELLASALLHSGRVLEAEGIIRQLLESSPRDPLHRLKLATLLQLQSRSGESLLEFQRVAAAYPDAPFAQEAHEAIEMLDNLQIQQILMRLSEQPAFEHQLRTHFVDTLESNGFFLTDEGRESLRHMMSDGRPEPEPQPLRLH